MPAIELRGRAARISVELVRRGTVNPVVTLRHYCITYMLYIYIGYKHKQRKQNNEQLLPHRILQRHSH